MRIGCPKEIKTREDRVGLTPAAVREAVAHGHAVLVEAGAGVGSGYRDADYAAVGAEVVGEAAEVWAWAELVVKVKEPQAGERAMLKPGQVLFAYLHLAPDPEQTRDLIASGATAIAYETVTDRNGGLPLLAPMSEVAGRLAPQVGAWTLQTANGGRAGASGSPGARRSFQRSLDVANEPGVGVLARLPELLDQRIIGPGIEAVGRDGAGCGGDGDDGERHGERRQ